MRLLDLNPAVLVFTATVPGTMTEQQRQQLEMMMNTFQLREPVAN
jgi:hypothetical protein